MLLIDEEKHFLRLIVGLLLTGYLIIMMRVAPYERAEDDLLACASQAALVIVFLCGILIQAFQSITEEGGSRLPGRRLVSTRRTPS